jgi:hypothetical protein
VSSATTIIRRGELAKRIDKKDPGDVFIYVASHGMAEEDDPKQVYLLPVDAKLDDPNKRGRPGSGRPWPEIA